MALSWRTPSALLRRVRPTKSLRPMRRTSPPSSVPGRDTYSSFRNLESVSEQLSFATASLGSERQDHRQFIEHDGRIFNKHGVGKSGLGGKRNNAGAQFTEQLLVSVVLFLGYG